MGVSENVVYLNVPNGFADHHPYEKWLFHWEYTQHFQTIPRLVASTPGELLRRRTGCRHGCRLKRNHLGKSPRFFLSNSNYYKPVITRKTGISNNPTIVFVYWEYCLIIVYWAILITNITKPNRQPPMTISLVVNIIYFFSC